MARKIGVIPFENSTTAGEEPLVEYRGKDAGDIDAKVQDNGNVDFINAIQTILSFVNSPADNSLRHTIVDESFQPIAKFFTDKILLGRGDVELFEDVKIENGILTAGRYAVKPSDLTLGAAATTFAVDTGYMTITGDAGANTVATITGGVDGEVLRLQFVDALVTITDDGTGTADTINLSAAFTSSANDLVTLLYDGTSWLELSRSVN